MSWIENINNIVLSITTGDDAVYTPKWLNATKEVEYNTAVYEFVRVKGSLALKSEPKGRRFDLEFYFDGEKNIDKAEAFEKSANNKKPWTVKHPYYGNFKCQPLSLKQDNSGHNVTKFTCTVIETITQSYPFPNEVLPDKIETAVTNANISQQKAFSDAGNFDKPSLTSVVNSFNNSFAKKITDATSLNLMNKIASDAINLIDAPLFVAVDVMRKVHELINFPAKLEQTIEDRFNILKEAYDNIVDIFDGTTSGKHQYEAVGGGIIGAMNLASIGDYETRSQITDQQTLLANANAAYLLYLDSLQTDRADSTESYIPNFNGLNDLNTVVSLTNASLFELIFEAKQEREYMLEKDSNAILLTHRFYGLDKDDVNLNKLLATNNIGLSEILNIKKGRKIVYYV